MTDYMPKKACNGQDMRALLEHRLEKIISQDILEAAAIKRDPELKQVKKLCYRLAKEYP